MYLIEILHQTTTTEVKSESFSPLYLIEILHQTTTTTSTTRRAAALYLIEILHQTTTWRPSPLFLLGCILSKFYIKPQQPPRERRWRCCCILSKFYIKPQHRRRLPGCKSSCILSKFYIKPQLRLERELTRCSCILSKFYIKPQPYWPSKADYAVVSYRNSTSNHNHVDTVRVDYMLYLIEILHQTTTSTNLQQKTEMLYLIEILHQTTTSSRTRAHPL